MSNITGLNPQKADIDFRVLSYNVWNAYTKIVKCFGWNIGTELSQVWASPKAVEFGIKFSKQFSELINDCSSSFIAIINNSKRAIEIMANANGVSVALDGEGEVEYMKEHQGDSSFDFKEEKDGIVGMNMIQTRIIMGNLDADYENLINDLDNLPLGSIALYDPNNELIDAFTSMIKNVSESITTLANSIKTDISSAMETETNEIRIAKQVAVDTMTA